MSYKGCPDFLSPSLFYISRHLLFMTHDQFVKRDIQVLRSTPSCLQQMPPNAAIEIPSKI